MRALRLIARAGARADACVDAGIAINQSLRAEYAASRTVETCVARVLADAPPEQLRGGQRVSAEVAARVRCRREHKQGSAQNARTGAAHLDTRVGIATGLANASTLGNASARAWPPFEIGPWANKRREDYCGVERPGAPFAREGGGSTSGIAGGASEGEAASTRPEKIFHQFAFSADGHSFVVDAYLHDGGLGESGHGGVYREEEESLANLFDTARAGAAAGAAASSSVGETAGGHKDGGSGGVVAVILSSDQKDTPAPMPLRCRFTSESDTAKGGTLHASRDGGHTTIVETPADMHLFGTRYAPLRGAHLDIHAYTILCPAPATILRDALPPPPRQGEEGSVVPGVWLSLVYDDGDSDSEVLSDDGERSIAWMQPITFRDMRMPPSGSDEPPPAQVDLAMCLSGVFGVGGGRFLPEYIEYHRALGVGRFEVRACLARRPAG